MEQVNGINFEWGLAGMHGAWFVLYPDKNHTDDDIQEAKKKLRSERDVVSIKIIRRSK